MVEQLEMRLCLAANPIVLENQLPGSPESEWDVNGAGDQSLQGFATDISVNHGQTVYFKIDDASQVPYKIEIYRMGYYGGMGARKVADFFSTPAHQIDQPAGIYDATTGLLDCGNWSVTDSWAVPADATSGIYFAKIGRLDTGGSSHIFFIVRNDEGRSEMLFQTSDTTWQAYNTYGGQSLYGYQSPAGQAVKVSYNRPYLDRSTDGINSFVFTTEYPMVRWLERNGYDVSYFTGVDSDRNGAEILEHKVFLSVGHDEYWSGEARANVEAARSAGVSLAFFSANEVFWKIRWENSVDGSGTPYRTLVCYKESEQGAKTDPLPDVWTGMWRDPRFSPPADGGRPENGLTGTIFVVNSMRNDPMYVPAEDGKLRFWRNTDIANLAAGQTATLPAGVLGYEWDIDMDNGFRPAGLIDMSHTTIAVDRMLNSMDATYGPGVATHSLTLYRAPSGALVFGAGTIQWAWGLDDNHDRAGTPVDARMQQATVNLFADMGVRPETLQSDLVAATASTDFTAPTSSITSPLNGTAVSPGDTITITGTATDAGGGVVGGVEVSVDGGLSWHPATGRGNWQYVWQVNTSGTIHILSRATDDSARIETPGAGVTVSVQGQQSVFSVWGGGVVPGGSPATDPQTISSGGVELGMKFQTDTAGQVLGVRLYKGAGNTGVHTGSLWDSGGNLLATATFSNETTSGWQTVNFSNPVTVQTGRTYTVSYHTTRDQWVRNLDYFTSGVSAPPLQALRDGFDGGNGVYRYGTGSVAPASSYRSSNYWVDVLLSTAPVADTTAPTVISQSPAAGSTGVARNVGIAARFSEGIDPLSGTVLVKDSADSTVAGTLSYDATTQTLTFQPAVLLAASTIYTVTISGVKDLAGNAMSAPVSWSFTTAAVDTTAPTVVSQSPAPSAANVATSTPITVGFSEAINPASVVLSVTDSGAAAVAGSSSYNPATNVLTFQPAAALSGSTTYTVSVNGAADLAGNVMAGTVSWSFTTAAVTVTPIGVFDNTAAPTGSGVNDAQTISAGGVELGMKFRSDVAGQVMGVKFYKGSGNTGVHTGSLWSSTGQLLATVTFANETTSGWQQALFSNPVATMAGQTYIVSYHTTTSMWMVNLDYFASSSTTNGPLHGLQNGTDGGNGVYVYGSTSASPSNSYRSSNYWVDVQFVQQPVVDTTAPTVISQSPAANATNVAQSTAITVGFSEAINPASVVLSVQDSGAGAVAGTSSYDSSTNVLTFRPTVSMATATTYTVNVSGAADLAGNVMVGTVSWSFTTALPDTIPPTVTAQSPAPNATNVAQSTAITVGFSEAVNPASVILSVKDSGGTAVAGTSSYNSSTNVLTFQPTALLAAPATYTVSVSGATDLAGNVMVGTASWSFTTALPDTIPPTLISQSPAPNATNVGTSTSIVVGFSEAIDPGSVTFRLRNSSGAAVGGTISYNSTTHVLTFTPKKLLAKLKTFTVSVSNATDLAGNVMVGTVSWSFTTGTAPTSAGSTATVTSGSAGGVTETQTMITDGVDLLA